MTIISDYDFEKIPFDKVISVGQMSMLYKDVFNVSWILGRFCNYRCSYCWEHGRSDKKDHRRNLPTSRTTGHASPCRTLQKGFVVCRTE